MGFLKNSNFKIVFLLALAIGVSLSATVSARQQVEDTSIHATDTTGAIADPNATVSADTSLTSDTAAMDSAAAVKGATPTATTEEAGKVSLDPQVYTNFFYYLLVVFLVCVLVAVVGKILQIYELTRRMNGRDTTYYMYNVHANLFLVCLVVGLYGVYWSYANHGAQSLRDAATEHGERIDAMFMITTVITTIVLVLTHIGLFGFAFKYRATPSRKAYFYPHNNTIEKVWTIVPAVVLTVLVLFGFFTWRSITNVPEEEQKNALHIEVIGEQFAWTVRYPGRDGQIGERNYRLTTPLNSLGIDFTDKSSWDDQLGAEIVLPVNRPVRVQITSKDILHSFYIPDFRVQMNAVPGMKTYFQFTPTVTTEEMRDKLGDYNYDFVMLCAKICGGGHYNMQKRVRVVTEEEYQAWLNEQPYFFTEDLRKEFQVSQASEEEVEAKKLLANAN
ncbi:cytochrome c oxidase subunit II [Parapedobacter sp. ISTM3]|uniref:Cytochrome c oxidase subunit 2 n=1 Tax=Parapedobacter luteus TaxID=623280 RepID=A0A1T5DS16_9SPHI|nr:MULTISPECIES: cytochrome c oxidase subunit II [Parapedobacter]MBK1440861.1 cytochrome c oxidase subunit II [Parapedobacter sp. ISTM3]SKB74306.1 cytochrome c oxidase subunit 2 [Parapedobacter luteus]